MSRLLVFALVVSLGNTSAAFAGETLLMSAIRVAREAARTEIPSQTNSSVAATRVEKSLAVPSAAAISAQARPGLATSGMSKRKKTIIWLVAGVGVAATAYTIDHKVQDVTPSSLGTRQD